MVETENDTFRGYAEPVDIIIGTIFLNDNNAFCANGMYENLPRIWFPVDLEDGNWRYWEMVDHHFSFTRILKIENPLADNITIYFIGYLPNKFDSGQIT